MKIMLVVAGLALTAVPAAAQVVHQTSVTHNGRTIALSYEPEVKTSFRQAGIGPRSSPTCFWKTRLSVKRSAVGPDGQPLAALSNVVEEARPRSGSQPGICASISERKTAAFGGDEAEMRAFLAEAANKDTGTVKTVLASLSHVGADQHAR